MDHSISFEKVSYIYQPNTPFASYALDNVTLKIQDNDLIALVGHTGSGKSTLVQQINGLLLPTEGNIKIKNEVLNNSTKTKDVYKIRKNVGFVFQQPEKQLFEDTVEKDIAFGPKNFGIPEHQLHQIAVDNIKKVGLDAELLQRSPFELSGGQMRRVAIAGVLATSPDILILDEPTAGLDPKGQSDIMNLVANLKTNHGVTVILVTHQMEIVAEYANRVLVLNHGKLYFDGTPRELFTNVDLLNEMHLAVPETVNFTKKLSQNGMYVDNQPITAEELVGALLQKINFKMSEENE